MSDYRIQRVKENDKIIIYRRLFDLRNAGGDKRYFVYDKIKEEDTGEQFRSITQVNKFMLDF